MAAERGQGESQRGTSVALNDVLAEYDRLAESSNDRQKTRVQLLQRHPRLNAELQEHFRIEDFLRGETSGQREVAAGGKSAAKATIPSTTIEQFIARVIKSQLMTEQEIRESLRRLPAGTTPRDGVELARTLIRAGKLTLWQAQLISKGIRGKLVLGNYALLEKLGQGGMGAVFMARHRRLDRVVALKILSPALGKSPELVARFQREAKAAAKLSHPNIVTAFDADEVEGQFFLVTEFLPGQDLSSVVKSRGLFSVVEALEVIIQAGRGLIYAHAHGVVHRDVKPSNILLGHDGTAKILDLGLARIWSEQEATRAQLTESGQLIGTVDFMSPEQASNPRDVDHRTDIYSLGLTLYFLLTGRVAYPGSTIMEKLLAHRDRPIPDLPSEAKKACPALDGIFRRMVSKERDDRYDTMDDVVADLEAARRGRVVKTPTPARLTSNSLMVAEGASTGVEASPSAETEIPHSVTIAEGPIAFQRKNRSRTSPVSGRWWIWGVSGLAVMSAVLLILQQMGREPEVADNNEPATNSESNSEPTPVVSTEVMLAVQRLISADADEVLERINDVAEHEADVIKPLVLQAYMDADEDSRQRLNCSLALLADDDSQLDYLYTRLLSADEDEYLLLTEVLSNTKEELVPRLWSDAGGGMLAFEQRLRIYCVLAAFDPDGSAWESVGSDVVQSLHAAGSGDLFWEDQLSPVGSRLIPALTEAYSSDVPPLRMMATRLLLREAGEDVEVLAGLVPVSNAEQLDVLLESLSHRQVEAVAELQAMLAESRAAEFDTVERANVAATLIRLGESQAAWEEVLSESESELLKYLLANGTQLNLTATDWQSALAFASTSAAKYLLFIALGADWDALDQTARDEVVEAARRSFAEAPAVAEHSAAEWLLRMAGDEAWMQDSLSELAIQGMTDSRDWYVTQNGITLAIFEMESDAADGPARRFAISTHEITGEQFSRFVEAHPDFSVETDEGMPPGMRESIRAFQEQLSQAMQQELPANCPRVNVNWFETAAFCRWLSDEEQFEEADMCFPRIERFEPVQLWVQDGFSFEFSSEDGSRPGVVQQEMTTINTNEHIVLTLPEETLSRSGYRLPTSGEWNVALSGGPSSTAIELLEGDFQYDWLSENAEDQVRPPGRLPPNEHGMFDLLGNVLEWCLDGEADEEADGAIQYGKSQYVTGYAANVSIESVTPDHLWAYTANWRENRLGFRVAQTLEVR